MHSAGCDCLGSIHYFDALMANSKGAPSLLQNMPPHPKYLLVRLAVHVKPLGMCMKAS